MIIMRLIMIMIESIMIMIVCVICLHDNHHHHHHHSPTGVMEKYRDGPFRCQFNGVMRFKVDLTSQVQPLGGIPPTG